MSVKTLNNAPAIGLRATAPQPRTYSIDPSQIPLPETRSVPSAHELESFLEAENPLGCIRGVMWVMAFNVAVFLLGFMIWQSCKLLF
jgi:hypothetical protein